nr:MarR family transcriptional regulator [uncultured Oscillibacter sp.]
MPEYQLEIRQLVSYPRCRIYREFLHTLVADRGVRTNGRPGLFCFSVLCSYANFRTSYLRIDGLTYTIYPGEWICRTGELTDALRLRSKRQLLEVLSVLQERHLIQYSLLGRGNLVKYKVVNWHRHNTVLDYNCPCQKETGFFFLPVSTAVELVSAEKCSEMDILLDLWISAVYRDEQVQGSFDGPVAYLRNGTGCPLVSYAELAQRWGLSKATVGRVLRKLERAGHIALLTFPGRHGTAIYLQNYLSTMFQISDVMVDKDEVAMSLNIQVALPADEPGMPEDSGSNGEIIVSNPAQEAVAQKVLQLLALQGVGCAKCPRMTYKLYALSRDSQGIVEKDTLVRRFRMDVLCPSGVPAYTFEISTRPVECEGGFCHGEEEG